MHKKVLTVPQLVAVVKITDFFVLPFEPLWKQMFNWKMQKNFKSIVQLSDVFLLHNVFLMIQQAKISLIFLMKKILIKDLKKAGLANARVKPHGQGKIC